jgi:uncharacterized membrane protein YfcA
LSWSIAILFGLAALACEVLGTIGGFGSSAFFVPVAQFFLPFQAVLAVTGLYHVASNVAKIALFHRNIDLRLTLLMGLPGIASVIAGAVLVAKVDPKVSVIALGGLLVVFALTFLALPAFRLRATNSSAAFAGGLAGFVAGFTGTGGAIRGAALAAFDIDRFTFVGTSAAIDLGVDATRSVIYVSNGFLSKEAYPYIPILFFVAFFGSWLGKAWLSKVNQSVFRTVVLLLLLIIGIALALGTITK